MSISWGVVHCVGHLYTCLTSDSTGFRTNSFFFSLDFLVVTVLLPLVLRVVDRRHWKAMRRKLVHSAFSAHKASIANLSALTRDLLSFGITKVPAKRLRSVQKTLDRQRENSERFYKKCNVFSAAVDASLAEMLTDTIEFCEVTQHALSTLTRAYLKDARVVPADNLVGRNATFGFDENQPFSTASAKTFNSYADTFVQQGSKNRAGIKKAMTWRERRKNSVQFNNAASDTEKIAARIRTFTERRHKLDPHLPQYLGREIGPVKMRSLDELILFFEPSAN